MNKKDFLEREKEKAHRKYSGNEITYLKNVLESGKLSGLLGGVFTKRFESAFADALGCKYAVAMNSCMSALHTAVIYADAGPGTEVICDAEFVFGAMAVLYNNAIPVFVDINSITHNMNPDLLEDAITERTKAVIVTHAWGLPAEIDRIAVVAKKYNLTVIEDCAESILAKYKGKNTGTYGDIGCFSFQASKQLSLGDGGMATMNDEHIYKAIAKHAGAPTFLSVAHSLDYNYRITEPIAAIGLAQLETISEHLALLRDNAKYYDEAVSNCKWLTLQRGPSDAEHTFYHWASTFDGERYGLEIKDFIQAIQEENISSISIGYTKLPAYKHPLFVNRAAHAFHCQENKKLRISYPDGLCPVAERVIPRIVMAYLLETSQEAKENAEKLNNVIRRIEKG